MYKQELLLKKPYLVIVFIWVFSLAVWIGVTMGVGLESYKLMIDFDPIYYITITNGILWFTPLVLILFLTIYIYALIVKKTRDSNRILARNRPAVWSTDQLATGPIKFFSVQYKLVLRVKKMNYGSLSKWMKLKASNRFLIIMCSYWIQW
jgi:hypothetical protein